MGIQFDRPWLLLLIALLIAYVWRLLRERSRLMGPRKAAAVALRTIILLLLVLAMSGIRLYDLVELRTIIFAADRSDSMNGEEAAAEWIRAAVSSKEPEDRAGVVSAGAQALVERSVTAEPLGDFRFDGVLNRQWTDLAGALRLSLGLLPAEGGGRIVLVSDGQENVGDVLKEGRLLRNRGIAVDVLHMGSTAAVDAAVDSLKVPGRTYQGEAYDVETTVISTIAADAELRLYEDNRELAVLKVRLEKGENRYAYPALAREAGLHRYRAEIYLPEDQQPENNAAYAFGRVSGRSKVLIVEGEDGTSKNMESALDAAWIAYETIPPEMLPYELSDYTAYDSILMNNVPATRISESRMERIEQAVRDYGIGLVMFGGSQSFGLGGYFQTPVENALPVYMEIKGKREIPSLALTLVIDKSGSMEGQNIRLAQEAAARSVDLLREKDTVGVLAFDSTPWWVVEPTKLSDKEQVKSNILSIRADGGTDIYPALQEAFQKTKEIEAQRKHIILLTDGQSSSQQSYEALAADMAEENITVSTVAIGDGADTRLLERIATLANGRYYFTRDMSTVPAIFSREAVLMSRTYVVETPFTPAFGQGADWYRLFADGVPQLDGYIAATAKETAETALLSPEGDPILARWRYGAGKSVAWTSDVTGKWSGSWTVWSRFPEFAAEVIKWTFPEFQQSLYELTATTAGGRTEVSVKTGRTDAEAGGGRLVLEVTDESLNKVEAALSPVVPGEYAAALDLQTAGVYMARIKEVSGSGTAEEESVSPVTGFVIPYSPEYRLLLQDEGAAKLEQLAELTGGRVLAADKPQEAFQVKPPSIRKLHDPVRGLLIAALLLWLADIAVRRLTLPWERIPALLGLVRRRLRPVRSAGPEPAGSSPFERLNRRKEKLSSLFEPSSGGSAAKPPDRHKPSSAGAPEAIPEAQAHAPREPDASAQTSVSSGDGVVAEDRMNRLLAAKNRKK